MRVLVTAASRHSATSEMAKVIADTLEARGIEVVLRRPELVGHLTGYDAVVLGSAIYFGRWLEPVTQLVERTGTQMRAIPVWLFSSGPIGDLSEGTELSADTESMLHATGAREHRLFGGRLDRDRLSLAERAITRLLRVAESDHRSWADITTWAEGIAASLEADARARNAA
jgi:menaquinone-dependent protoporphyrinogen oxidase